MAKTTLRFVLFLVVLELGFARASVAKPSGQPIDYLIITSRALKASQIFQLFIDTKTARGLSVDIESVEEIVQVTPGRDAQEKIRNFIKQKYMNNGLLWVLLGGDTHLVPVRTAMVDKRGEVVSDMYYSCLDGDWDANGNNIFGEFDDNVDLYPEVFVGRAPVKNEDDVRTFVNKVRTYESNAQKYADKILLLGDSDFDDAGGTISELIASEYLSEGFDVTKYYQREIPAYRDLTINAINAGAHIINHMGHGSVDGLQTGSDWLELEDVDRLTNASSPAILRTVGCSPLAIDKDSIAEHWMNNPNGGGVAFIGSSRYAPFPEANQYLAPAFFESLFRKHITRIGQTLADSKIAFIAEANRNPDMRYALLELALLGDPEMAIQADSGAHVDITSPKNTGYVRGQVEIFGSAFLKKGFQRYELYYARKEDPDHRTLLYSSRVPVENGLLNPGALWDTKQCLDGAYLLILEMVTKEGKTIAWRNALEVTVDNVNQPPEFFNVRNTGAVIGRPLAFTIQAVDPDDPKTPWGALRYAATNLPPGAQFNPETRVFSWQPEEVDRGTYRVTFTATDGQYTTTKTVIISTVDVQDIQITPHQSFQAWPNKPCIYKERIAWIDARTGNNDVYSYDLLQQQERAISTNPEWQDDPAIEQNVVLWRESKGGLDRIVRYDFVTQQESLVAALGAGGWDFDISSDKAVYVRSQSGRYEVDVYDFSAQQERVISAAPGLKMSPVVSGDKIAWMDKRNGNWDIYLYDLTLNQEMPLTVNPAVQQYPAIYGDKVVWQDYRNGNSDIYLYDLSANKEIRITEDPGEQVNPAMYEDKIIWKAFDRTGGNIFLYDLSTGLETQLTYTTSASDFKMYQDKIVWRDYLPDGDRIALRVATVTLQNTIPPVLTLVSPTAGGRYTTPVNVEGTVTDDLSTIKFVFISVDKASPVGVPVARGKFSYQLVDLAAGSRTMTVTATDDARNETTQGVTIIVQSPVGELRGRVYGYDLRWPLRIRPLPHAEIVVKRAGVINRVLTADKNGLYDLRNLPQGRYTVSAAYYGYRPQHKKADLSAGKVSYANFSLVKAPSIPTAGKK